MAERRLEVCVDDYHGLMAAVTGGADRIELCSALSVGGLTPSRGLMDAAAKLPVPSYAMIRPRAGNFTYGAAEIDIMKRDIDAAREAGLPGVVFGANRADRHLDEAVLSTLVAHAQGLGITLHRAIDLTPDIAAAVRLTADLGFERILTSGGARTAKEGLDGLKQAFDAAAGRLTIMPGSGVNLETVEAILAAAPFTEIHASCAAPVIEPDARVLDMAFASPAARRTDADKVRALRARIAELP
ncbi:copper homeostasis protein CutC [Rhizobium sp. YJ-22]|uniref:copper homeostasis protein CutC n=1 Tax=Rhizobium sp. YJ-22 TaxID=3037556 RepID=UPI00241222D0|nr:copper homeostasis protein CutC [Rhizobium sp. YJ-22]MDG3578013.1 copper homeostasis protein CutC [Rhizobium sp. YJ-22]